MDYTVTDLGMNAPYLRDIPHVSNSQRVRMAICPAAYDFGKNQRLPDTPTSDSERGKALHVGIRAWAVELLANGDCDDAVEAGLAAVRSYVAERRASKHAILFLPRYDKGPEADWGSIVEDACEALPLLVGGLLQRFEILSVEHGFLVDFGTGEPTLGYADLILRDRVTGELVLLDVKTGLKTKSTADLLEDDALVIYAAGAELTFGRPQRLTYASVVFGSGKKAPRVRYSFVLGPDGGLGIPYDPLRIQRIATHQRALHALKSAGLFLPLQTSWACARCAFVDACEEKYGPTGIPRRGTVGDSDAGVIEPEAA